MFQIENQSYTNYFQKINLKLERISNAIYLLKQLPQNLNLIVPSLHLSQYLHSLDNRFLTCQKGYK